MTKGPGGEDPNRGKRLRAAGVKPPPASPAEPGRVAPGPGKAKRRFAQQPNAKRLPRAGNCTSGRPALPSAAPGHCSSGTCARGSATLPRGTSERPPSVLRASPEVPAGRTCRRSPPGLRFIARRCRIRGPRAAGPAPPAGREAPTGAWAAEPREAGEVGKVESRGGRRPRYGPTRGRLRREPQPPAAPHMGCGAPHRGLPARHRAWRPTCRGPPPLGRRRRPLAPGPARRFTGVLMKKKSFFLTSGHRFKMATMETVSRDPRARVR